MSRTSVARPSDPTIRSMSQASSPQDRLIDRRAFFERMVALTAGAAMLPAVPAVAVPAVRVRMGDRAAPLDVRQLADPSELTLAEAAALIRRRELSPFELVDAYLDRIERLDGIYRAFNVVLAGPARAEARRAADMPAETPLHGLPLAIKDNFYTAGVRTTANSLIFEDFLPAYDATAVARLKAAGAIILGKTQMGPLATTRATT
ncbi:MAG: amidase family protein, partial [Longimicrobiales bacterium]